MEVMELLNSPEIQEMANRYIEVQKRKKVNAWNIFNLSSYNNQLENFHSDIIASLLDPKGLHGEGEIPLMLFVDFLNEKHGLRIAPTDFYGSWVQTETNGRIDIGIFSEGTRKCILIENKMNNAPDMSRQLDRYYERVAGEGYKVEAIVYLSLDGTRKAPLMEVETDALVNVAAFAGCEEDITNGWLELCISKFTHDDSISFVRQYIKIIKQIASNVMDNETLERFYQFVSEPKQLTAVDSIVELRSKLCTYRRDKFIKSVSSTAPFKSLRPYSGDRNRAAIFEHYPYMEHIFRIGVWFEDDAVVIYFAVLDKNKPGGVKALQQKLVDLGMVDDFTYIDDKSDLVKKFHINDIGTMETTDTKALEYVKEFIEKLRMNAKM